MKLKLKHFILFPLVSNRTRPCFKGTCLCTVYAEAKTGKHSRFNFLTSKTSEIRDDGNIASTFKGRYISVRNYLI